MRGRFPAARRGLLIPWLGWSRRGVGELVLRSMARGWIDLYVIRPTRRRDEVFHRTISELLQESERLHGEGPAGAIVLADSRSAAQRTSSARASPGSGFRIEPSPRPTETAGRRARRRPGAGRPGPRPAARALGFPTELESHEADLVVVGAGPAGLGAAVYGASEGLRTTVLDSGAVGGQAGSSSLIRNYLGFPRGLGGGELAQRAYQQAWLFGVQFRLTHRARRSSPATDGTSFARRAAPRSPRERSCWRSGSSTGGSMPPAWSSSSAGVYYGASMSEAQALAGENVYVVGGGNSAGQAALHLARYACKVRILVRGTASPRRCPGT